MAFLLKALLVKVVDGLTRSPVLCLYLRVSFHVANKVLIDSLAAACRDLGGQKKNGFGFCFVCLFVCLFVFVVVVVFVWFFFQLLKLRKRKTKNGSGVTKTHHSTQNCQCIIVKKTSFYYDKNVLSFEFSVIPEGLLPIVGYRGRLRPKGVPFFKLAEY